MGTATLFLTAVWDTDMATGGTIIAMGDTGTAMILNTGTVMGMVMIMVMIMDTIMDMAIHMRSLTATVRSGAAFSYFA